jgi:hypothetical protein
MSNKIQTLAADIQRLAYQLAGEAVDAMKPPPPDIEPILVEWLAVKTATDAHLKKWEGVKHEDSEEQRIEWRAICERSWQNEKALTAFARAFVESKEARPQAAE